MNVMNWLFVFIASLLGIGAIGYLYNRSSQRRSSLWNMLSLAFAGLICATMFATLFVYSPTVTSAVQAAAAQSFTCVGTPALVRAGDAVAITGVAAADSEVTIVQGETTLATATADNAGAFTASITLGTPGLQNVTCQSDANVVTLSFLVIGQAAPAPTATNTPEPTATDTPEPTATNTTEPTATDTAAPAAVAPEIDPASIPEQILPGDTFRLRGTTAPNARVRVAVNSKVVAGAVAGASGNWRATVGFAAAGTYTLTAQLVENDKVAAESEAILIEVIAPTPEPTATNTPEPTATDTPEPTATDTPEPTATNTPEPTATNTPEPTATDTPEPTATNTPEPTATNTPEPTATDTPEPTATNTPEPTATNTPEPTATNTPEPTATDTPEPTATDTPEPTATSTPEPVAPAVDTASIPEQILPGDTFRLRGTAASSAKVHVLVNDKVVASAVAGPNGNWRTTIGFAAAGTYTVTTQLMDNDTAVAASEPILVEVIAPEATPTNTPEPAPTATTAAPVDNSAVVSDTATTVDSAAVVSDTAMVSDTTSVWVDNSQAVSETVPAVDASQAVSDTVAAPDALPGTGSDFSQGVPWVILLLVFGALLTLGIGRLSHKPTA